MSEDVVPYGAADDPAVARTNELRALISDLGASQREAADLIEIDTRSMRRWVSRDPAPPLMAVYAFRYLAAIKRGQLQDVPRALYEQLAGVRRVADAGGQSK